MALTLEQAISAGALAEAIGLVAYVPSYYDLATRLRRDYPGLGIKTSRDIALLAKREVAAAQDAAALTPGEQIPTEDVPINPLEPAGEWTAAVRIMYRSPDGTLDQVRVDFTLPANFTGSQLHDAVHAWWDNPSGPYQSAVEGATFGGYRLFAIDRGE